MSVIQTNHVDDEAYADVEFILFLESTLQSAIITLIFYEHLLTVGEEIRLVWGRRVTSAILFILNRITMLGLGIVWIIGIAPWNLNVNCEAVNTSILVFVLMSACISAVAAALRVYVVSGRNRYLSAPVLLLGLVPVAANVFLETRSQSVVSSNALQTLCGAHVNLSWTTDIRWTVATCSCAILANSIVLVVTWYNIYDSVYKYADGVGAGRPTFGKMLLIDGTMYFITLTLLNAVGIGIIVYTDGVLSMYMFIFPISSILVSRFLLHVREVAELTEVDFGSETPSFVRSRSLAAMQMRSQVSTVVFARNGTEQESNGPEVQALLTSCHSSINGLDDDNEDED